MRNYRFMAPAGVLCGLIAAFALRTSYRRAIVVNSSGPTIIVNTGTYPTGTTPAVRPTIEMAFVLDTTGSMTGLIDAAKQKIWCIINSVMQSPVHPVVKVGLVAYRDHGDDYITKVLPMTDDLDKVYSTLMQYRAAGGGDRPEDVRQAMADAVHKIGWSNCVPGMAQLMFLVGDSPPHDDYTTEPDCLTSAAEALQRGILVNAIECGDAQDTKEIWQHIARRGQGKFMAIAQAGGVKTITTPYDEDLSKLGSDVDAHYMSYGGSFATGGAAAAPAYRAKMAADEKAMTTSLKAEAPTASMADRAVNKAINSEAYKGDLITDVANGKVKIETIDGLDLPDDLRNLLPEARKAEMNRRIAERDALKAKILDLSKKRDAYIANEKKRSGLPPDGFDAVVTAAIKSEAASKGVKL